MTHVKVSPYVTITQLRDGPLLASKGWYPVLGVTRRSDGETVLRVTDWRGGEGDKPLAGYVGAAGLVASASDGLPLTVTETTGGGLSEAHINGLIRTYVDANVLAFARDDLVKVGFDNLQDDLRGNVDNAVVTGEISGSNLILKDNDDDVRATIQLPGGEANVQADWDETDTASDRYIRNKPALAPADAEANVQADWNATSGDAFVRNKPDIEGAIASDIANDAVRNVATLPTSGTVGQVVFLDPAHYVATDYAAPIEFTLTQETNPTPGDDDQGFSRGAYGAVAGEDDLSWLRALFHDDDDQRLKLRVSSLGDLGASVTVRYGALGTFTLARTGYASGVWSGEAAMNAPTGTSHEITLSGFTGLAWWRREAQADTTPALDQSEFSNEGNVQFEVSDGVVEGHVDLPKQAEGATVTTYDATPTQGQGYDAGVITTHAFTWDDRSLAIQGIGDLDDTFIVLVTPSDTPRGVFTDLSLKIDDKPLLHFAEARRYAGTNDSDDITSYSWRTTDIFTAGTQSTISIVEQAKPAAAWAQVGNTDPVPGPKLEVGTDQLINASVTNGKVADGSITVDKLAPGVRPSAQHSGYIAQKYLSADQSGLAQNTEHTILTTDPISESEAGYVIVKGQLDADLSGNSSPTVRIKRTRGSTTTTVDERHNLNALAFDEAQAGDVYSLTYTQLGEATTTVRTAWTHVAIIAAGGAVGVAGEIPAASNLPANPQDGRRVVLLEARTWRVNALLTPADLTGGAIGWRTANNPPGAITGILTESISAIYWQDGTTGTAALRNRIVVVRTAGEENAPLTVVVGGTSHTLELYSGHIYRSTSEVSASPLVVGTAVGITGTLAGDGHFTELQSFDAFSTVIWHEMNWHGAPGTWSQGQLEDEIRGVVADPAEAGSAAPWSDAKLRRWSGTQAEYDAITSKDSGVLYLVTS